MAEFLNDDFLLNNKTARTLFHDHAKSCPIYDFHSHLPANEIAEDRRYENMTQIWLAGDHYKWRGMRSNGVPEKYCTGDASDYEKFEKWAETVPHTLGNPLYHWTHLELKDPFGIGGVILNPDNARAIYDACNEKLQDREFSARALLRRADVRVVCSTDDPIDSLEHHKSLQEEKFEVGVYPTWRPDKAIAAGDPESWNAYLEKLSEVSGVEIHSSCDLLSALEKRMDFFHETGCRLSDHGLERFHAAPQSNEVVMKVFQEARNGQVPNADELDQFQGAILLELCRMYNKRGWAQQFHIGALRNNNTRLFKSLGRDIGCDSINDLPLAAPMSRFLDTLDQTNELAPTILYNLNGRDNDVFASMIGNFQDGSKPGKMQFGSGWWFNDQKDGMERQMISLANNGLLSRFVGMLTDSRSFLSFSRHEYFRRILCNLIGNWVENGEIPNDMEMLGPMVENICYNNANEYFAMHNPSDQS